MAYKVKIGTTFKRQSKRLLKKYPSLTDDLAELITSLRSNPIQGSSLAKSCYKIRLNISSKSKGKSGGARVITCVVSVSTEVYLLSIYDKSEQESITDSELAALLQEIPN